jgi:hypothetical protein
MHWINNISKDNTLEERLHIRRTQKQHTKRLNA